MQRDCGWKIVRDRLAPVLEAEGWLVRAAGPVEAERLLRLKVVEEALELAETGSPEEAADLLEALYEWMRAAGVDPGRVEELRRSKRASRGGFARRIAARPPCR